MTYTFHITNQGIQGNCANTESLHEHNYNMIIGPTLHHLQFIDCIASTNKCVIYTDLLTELNTDILYYVAMVKKKKHHTLSERVVSVTNAKDSNKWHHEKVCQKWDSNPRLQM